MFNYFNFKEFRNGYLITNDLGEYQYLSPQQFQCFLKEDFTDLPELKKELEEKGFVYYDSALNFSWRVRYRIQRNKSYIFKSTQLHIFVVTTACNHNCVYCQAQNGYNVPNGLMSRETALKAVETALSSPGNSIDFEFQGGEPLINFDVIRFIVEYTESRKADKKVNYSIVTNLTLLTDEMEEFILEHKIGLSTSLDGDHFLHNNNRPLRSGKDAYDLITQRIIKLKNKGIVSGALLTVTKSTLTRHKEIVDAYVACGLHTISLRPLTPLGCADKNWSSIGYNPEEFISFYCKALDYIIEINKSGYRLSESMARIFLIKILDHEGLNYMELRSPCGAAIGQIAYYYDGEVYTCDEGRMLAEMGNPIFRLGSLESDDYNALMEAGACRNTCSASILEAVPSCSDCIYQPYCGTCPVVTYALEQDLYEKMPGGYRCRINQGILDKLFSIIIEDDNELMKIIYSWIE